MIFYQYWYFAKSLYRYFQECFQGSQFSKTWIDVREAIKKKEILWKQFVNFSAPSQLSKIHFEQKAKIGSTFSEMISVNDFQSFSCQAKSKCTASQWQGHLSSWSGHLKSKTNATLLLFCAATGAGFLVTDGQRRSRKVGLFSINTATLYLKLGFS